MLTPLTAAGSAARQSRGQTTTFAHPMPAQDEADELEITIEPLSRPLL